MQIFPNQRQESQNFANERRKDRIADKQRVLKEYQTYYTILGLCLSAVFMLIMLATFGGYNG